MSNLFSPSKAKMEIKPGQALLKRKATRTCVRTPRSPKVPSFEKYVVYVYYFHDVYTYMFILSSFIAKISLLIVGYRRSQEYKPRRNADPRNLTFHESFKDIPSSLSCSLQLWSIQRIGDKTLHRKCLLVLYNMQLIVFFHSRNSSSLCLRSISNSKFLRTLLRRVLKFFNSNM